MIYTIGAGYIEGAAAKHPVPIFKVGRRKWGADYYPGGSVWQTFTEARLAAQQASSNSGHKYRPYGVFADWTAHTAISSSCEPGETYNDLLIDAPLTNLDAEGAPVPWPHEDQRPRLLSPFPNGAKPCVVCGIMRAAENMGYWCDEGYAPYPVCRFCHETGPHEAWRRVAIEEVKASNLGLMIREGWNLAEHIKEIRAFKKHDSRIEDGICPNGCARMIQDDTHNVHCPVCRFSYYRNVGVTLPAD